MFAAVPIGFDGRPTAGWARSQWELVRGLALIRFPDSVVVTRAWRSAVDGFTVTTGELTWNRNALAGAVGTPECPGVFVVVTCSHQRLTQPSTQRSITLHGTEP